MAGAAFPGNPMDQFLCALLSRQPLLYYNFYTILYYLILSYLIYIILSYLILYYIILYYIILYYIILYYIILYYIILYYIIYIILYYIILYYIILYYTGSGRGRLGAPRPPWRVRVECEEVFVLELSGTHELHTIN